MLVDVEMKQHGQDNSCHYRNRVLSFSSTCCPRVVHELICRSKYDGAGPIKDDLIRMAIKVTKYDNVPTLGESTSKLPLDSC